SFVKSFVAGKVHEAIFGSQRQQMTDEERRELMLQQREGEAESRVRDVMIHVRSLIRGYIHLTALLREHPELCQMAELGRLLDKSSLVKQTIAQFNQCVEREYQRRSRR